MSNKDSEFLELFNHHFTRLEEQGTLRKIKNRQKKSPFPDSN